MEEKPKRSVIVEELGSQKLMATQRAGRAAVPLKAAFLMACVPMYCKGRLLPGDSPWVCRGRAWHLPEDKDGPKLWKVGPQVGLWLGRLGLWGAADRTCCSVTGAGADMGSWAMSRGRGAFPGDWAGTARAGGALGA